jgi:hypothetical protein
MSPIRSLRSFSEIPPGRLKQPSGKNFRGILHRVREKVKINFIHFFEILLIGREEGMI